MHTKGFWRTVGIGLLLLVAVSAGAAQDEETTTVKRCSNSTVRGTWIGGGTGWSLVDTPVPAPTTVVTTLVLNGRGGATGTTLEKGITLEHERGVIQGTYSVAADCTGTASLTDTHPDGSETHEFAVLVAPDGSEIEAISTELPLALNIKLRRVPRR